VKTTGDAGRQTMAPAAAQHVVCEKAGSASDASLRED